MVFFTCSGCGTSLKKNKVDQHLQRCHQYEYLTCIDCSKDFRNGDYKKHISCVTEDEKYGKVGFKSALPKGAKKQQEWNKKIEILVANPKNLDRETVFALTRLQNFNNVPRKKGKFMNFLRTNMKIQTVIGEKIWQMLNDADTTGYGGQMLKSSANENNENVSSNVIEEKENQDEARNRKNNRLDEKISKKRKREENVQQSKKKKKAKLMDVHTTAFQNAANENNNDAKVEPQAHNDDSMGIMSSHVKFPWKKAIKSCLKTADDNKLSMKKLKKKIWSEYVAFEEAKEGGKPALTEGSFNSTLLKKINKNPKFRLHKEKVQLVV